MVKFQGNLSRGGLSRGGLSRGGMPRRSLRQQGIDVTPIGKAIQKVFGHRKKKEKLDGLMK